MTAPAKVSIDLGTRAGGDTAMLDLEELLATRLLVQGNSGSGKSHLLRRLLEQSAPWVQQAIIDPEGDFVTLADRYGHVVVDAQRGEADLQRIAARGRAGVVEQGGGDLGVEGEGRHVGSHTQGKSEGPHNLPRRVCRVAGL